MNKPSWLTVACALALLVAAPVQVEAQPRLSVEDREAEYQRLFSEGLEALTARRIGPSI